MRTGGMGDPIHGVLSKYEPVPALEQALRTLLADHQSVTPQFYKAVYDIQRRYKSDGKLFIELADIVGKVGAKRMGRRPKTAKTDVPVECSMSVTPDGELVVSLTLRISKEMLNSMKPESGVEVPSAVEVDVEVAEAPVVKSTPPVLRSPLRQRYIDSATGTDPENKDPWQAVLYHSIDKGRIPLERIALVTGLSVEKVRWMLRTQYNVDIVTIDFYDGESAVDVRWNPN